jgi:hypothetical protein
LKRSPLFPRMVRNKQGRLDALDQLSGTPSRDEEIFVCRRVAVDGHCHTRRQKFGGFFPLARYQLHGQQPDDETARGPRSWQDWCLPQQKELTPNPDDGGGPG